MVTTIRPSLHPKTKGDVAEAHVTARFLELGMTVLKPIGDNARYDLVIHDATRAAFYRVQCKTGHLNPRAHDVLVFPACSSACHTNAGKRDYRGDVDYFAVWFPEGRTVYLIPVDVVGTTEVSLRLAPARNGQAKGVRYAADYMI